MSFSSHVARFPKRPISKAHLSQDYKVIVSEYRLEEVKATPRPLATPADMAVVAPSQKRVVSRAEEEPAAKRRKRQPPAAPEAESTESKKKKKKAKKKKAAQKETAKQKKSAAAAALKASSNGGSSSGKSGSHSGSHNNSFSSSHNGNNHAQQQSHSHSHSHGHGKNNTNNGSGHKTSAADRGFKKASERHNSPGNGFPKGHRQGKSGKKPPHKPRASPKEKAQWLNTPQTPKQHKRSKTPSPSNAKKRAAKGGENWQAMKKQGNLARASKVGGVRHKNHPKARAKKRKASK